MDQKLNLAIELLKECEIVISKNHDNPSLEYKLNNFLRKLNESSEIITNKNNRNEDRLFS